MKNQILKFVGFCFISQIYFGVARELILTLSAGNKIFAMYMCAVALTVYGTAVLRWYKKKHTTGWFWKAVQIIAIIMLIAAVLSFAIAPFPNIYNIRGMPSTTAALMLK